MADSVIEELDEEQCLALIEEGGVGRIAYTGRYGPVVLPVNFVFRDGAVLFRTTQNGALDEDLRTGITDAAYVVAFEIDSIDLVRQQGWSVLIQGPAHHVAADDAEAAHGADVRPWAPGDREMFVKIVPSRVTGRRVSGT